MKTSVDLPRKRMALVDLQPDPNNPRVISEAAAAGLRSSLQRFGLVEPIVWNKRTGFIVGGHQRLDQLREIGVTHTEVVVVDLDEKKARALLLALNNRALQGTFTDAIEDLLADLRETDADLVGELLLEDLDIDLPSPPREKRKPAQNLAEKFGAPPFTILDGRQGYWLKRREEWFALGFNPKTGKEHLPGTACSTSSLDVNGKAAGGSTYDPVFVELMLRWFCPRGGRVLDPMCGGPTAAVVAACLGYRFFGYDVRAEQVKANEEEWAKVRERMPAGTVDPTWVHHDVQGLQKIKVEMPFDFLIMDPPFYNLEKYSVETNRWKSASEFSEWLVRAIEYAAGLLAEERFFAMKFGDVRAPNGSYFALTANLVDRLVSRRNGIHLYNAGAIVTPMQSLAPRTARNFPAARKLGKAHQDFLVFFKGDPLRVPPLGDEDQETVDLGKGFDEAPPEDGEEVGDEK